MPVTPPTDEDLARIADHYGFHLGPEDLRSFGALAGNLLVSYDEVERLYEATRPKPPQRDYQWPAASGNELGAWYVTAASTPTRCRRPSKQPRSAAATQSIATAAGTTPWHATSHWT